MIVIKNSKNKYLKFNIIRVIKMIKNNNEKRL